MTNLKQLFFVAGVTLALAFSTVRVAAQGPGGPGGFGGGGGGMAGFDSSQMYQMIVDAQRDNLSVTNDDDWKAISPKLLKVVQLQMQARTAGIGNMFGGMRGGAGGGARRAGGMFGGAPDPADDALQAALDNNAPIAQVKAALAKVRASREQKRVELAKAQSDLRELLTTRQEATLVSAGLLD